MCIRDRRERERERFIDNLHHLPNIKVKVRSEKGKHCAWFDSNLSAQFTNVATDKASPPSYAEGHSGTSSQQKKYYHVNYFPQLPAIQTL